jgi:hypothetical protein
MLENSGYNAINLNVDLIVVAQVTQIGSSKILMGYGLVKNIQNLLNLNWDVYVFRAYRQSNR